MNSKKPVILFLPEAGIHPFLQTISLVGNVFKQNGHRVYLIDCRGVLDRCPKQASFGNQRMFSEEEKKQLCGICSTSVKLAVSYYGFDVLSLEEFIGRSDIELIEALVPPEISEYEAITYKGCRIGRLAIHDLMIETKILQVSSALNNTAIEIYKGYIFSMAKIITIIEKMNNEINPCLYITFNPYSQNQAVKYAAESFQSSFACISNKHHCGANWQLLEYDGSLFSYNQINNYELWKQNTFLRMPPYAIARAFDDLLYRMSNTGSHIFSSTRTGNLDQFINTYHLHNKTILLAFTTSQDERLGGDICREIWGETINSDFAFQTQIEWLLFLQDFLRGKDELYCIVRIHPREARDGGSEHLNLLRNTFKTNSVPNFHIVWPDDAISSYDLMEIADVCLVSSSTTGLESMRLGVPLLSYYSKRGYVDDGYVCVATDKKSYQKSLEKITKTKYDYKYLLNAVRFYCWRIFIQSLFLGENVPSANIPLPYGEFFPAKEDINSLLYNVLTEKTTVFEYNYNQLAKDQASISEEDELKGLRTGLYRLINVLFAEPAKVHNSNFFLKILRKICHIFCITDLCFSSDPGKLKKYPLKYFDSENKIDDIINLSRCNRKIIYIFQDGIYCYKILNGHLKKFTSKALGRLSKMYQSINTD
jgi:hypothetical protein